jgi:hypothetical protein
VLDVTGAGARSNREGPTSSSESGTWAVGSVWRASSKPATSSR